MKKKIALIGPCYPYRGGNALFISHLHEALSKEFEVELINYKVLYPSLLFPGTTQFDKSDEHYSEFTGKRMVNSMGPLSWWRTAQYIKKMNPDLVAIDWWQPFFGPSNRAISAMLRRHFPNKILFITENVISHESRKIDQFLTKLGLKHADKFLALSNIVEKDLPQYSRGQKIYRSELPIFGWFKADEGIDKQAEKQKLGFEANNKVLLFFGYVRRYKGLDILLEAFADLVAQDNNLRLLVAGEFYDDPKFYFDIIEKLNIGDKVKVINQYIANEELAKYFQLSEVVVMPYRSGTQSGILNIAYGYNKPAVITDVGGFAEFVDDGKTAVMVAKADKYHIAAGVRHYFELAKTVDFEDNIRRRVAENGFGKITEVFKEILKDSE